MTMASNATGDHQREMYAEVLENGGHTKRDHKLGALVAYPVAQPKNMYGEFVAGPSADGRVYLCGPVKEFVVDKAMKLMWLQEQMKFLDTMLNGKMVKR